MDNSKSMSKKSSLKIRVQIMKGSKPPLFTQQLYRVQLPDDVGIGTSITTISTTDLNPMSTSSFKVSSGEFSDKFCVDGTKVSRSMGLLLVG